MDPAGFRGNRSTDATTALVGGYNNDAPIPEHTSFYLEPRLPIFHRDKFLFTP